jgi:hypothetical protein
MVGLSTTETTFISLSAGQGLRATSSTAISLQDEPSTARRIFMVNLRPVRNIHPLKVTERFHL